MRTATTAPLPGHAMPARCTARDTNCQAIKANTIGIDACSHHAGTLFSNVSPNSRESATNCQSVAREQRAEDGREQVGANARHESGDVAATTA